MIINLRGTNGSGKSTVARGLMAHDPATKIVNLAPSGQKGLVETFVQGYHVPNLDLCVVGLYKTACGGCDGIKTQELIHESVKLAAGRYKHVFFEGVVVSTIFSSYLTLATHFKLHDKPFVWAYMDTPLQLCLDRVGDRNGGKQLKTSKAYGKEEVTTIEKKFKSIASTRAKAKASGELVLDIPHEAAVETILELLA